MTTRRFTQLDDVWPAGIGRRLGAMLYDGFLVMAIWIAVTVAHLAFFRFVLGQTAEEIGTTAFDIWSLRLMLLFFVTLFFVYSWRRGGMTLGMQAWRLRVQTLDGHAITLKQSLIAARRPGCPWRPSVSAIGGCCSMGSAEAGQTSPPRLKPWCCRKIIFQQLERKYLFSQ